METDRLHIMSNIGEKYIISASKLYNMISEKSHKDYNVMLTEDSNDYSFWYKEEKLFDNEIKAVLVKIEDDNYYFDHQDKSFCLDSEAFYTACLPANYIHFNNLKMGIIFDRYHYFDNLCIELIIAENKVIEEEYGEEEYCKGEPWSSISTNIEPLEDDLIAVDTNNFPEGVKILEMYGIATFTGMWVLSGFCQYPVYRVNKNKAENYQLVFIGKE